MSASSAFPGNRHEKSGYWLWEPEGSTIALLLRLPVIEDIRRIVLAGFNSLPKRGLETGGMLFGRTELLASGRRLITVEGCEAFESEHVTGPSYVLSTADRKTLQNRLDELTETEVVGWFRSQTRDGLSPDTADADLFHNFLGNGTILLLVKPERDRSTQARILARENGEFRDFGLESFPFSSKSLDQGSVLSMQPQTTPAGRNLALAAAPLPKAQPAATPRPNRNRYWQWIWLPVALSVVLIGAMLWQHRRPIPPAPTVVQYGNPKLLELQLERHGDGVKLLWNKDVPEVQRASKGTLVIDDGGVQTRFDLDSSQLQGGSVAYHPNSADVTFRLGLDSPSGHVSSEPLHAYLQPAVASEQPVQLAQNPGAAPVVTQMRSRSRVAIPGKNVIEEKPSPAKPLVAAARATPSPQFAEMPSIATASSGSLPSEPLPIVANVRVEPAPESTLKRSLHNIPVIGLLGRRHYKAGENFAPAKAVLHVPPRLPAQAMQDKKDLGVDLRLTIDEEGQLQKTEVLTPEADHRALSAAVASVRKWRFEPGRIGDKPVTSKVIARFRF